MPVKKKPIRAEHYEIEVKKAFTDEPAIGIINEMDSRFQDSEFTSIGVKWFEFTVIYYDDDSFEIE